MKTRKLFQAKDTKGDLRYIEDLGPGDKDSEFFCPHCGEPVKPKMGKKVAWHFAHIGQTCEPLKGPSKPDEAVESKDIWSFTKKFTIGSDFSLDPSSYQCELCKVIQDKSYGVKWSDAIYLCKECYSRLDREKIQQLQWKSMF